ncbi:MAG: 4-hydroxy-tetrahydrodipicolinate synthase [Clostridiales bacterium]|nr:4-hydroxy-tetrahydrodipicolinate synthase [Clostridiales bacterium]
MALFKGCGAAMVTPFGKDGQIDYAVLEGYIEHLIDGGVSALLPFGTTGEPPTVSPEEYKKATEFIVSRAKGRVPVIVGAGSNSTSHAAEKAAAAKSYGADGVLVVTPYYNKCTQKGLVEHYKAVVKAAGVPVLAYNVPARTGVNIAPKTLVELKKAGVVGVKEASGDVDQFHDVAKVCDDVGLDLYCGDDILTTMAISLGSIGTISVAANPAPKEISALCALALGGKYEEARALQFKLSEFIHALFIEVNPIPVKKAMQYIGIDVGIPRLPLTELEPEHAEILKSEMIKVGLIK